MGSGVAREFNLIASRKSDQGRRGRLSGGRGKGQVGWVGGVLPSTRRERFPTLI